MAGPLDVAAAQAALRRADFDWTRTLGSVWRDGPADIAELNGAVVRLLLDEFAERTGADAPASPLGRIVLGRAGAGKTHLLGTLRREVWQRGGWFVLLDLVDVNDFWGTAALCFVAALGHAMPDGRSQAEHLRHRLRPPTGAAAVLARLGMGKGASGGLRGAEALLDRLRSLDRAGAAAHRDVAVAFACLVDAEPDAQDIARAWLLGGELSSEDRQSLRLRATVAPRQVVEGLSWLMALAGPTLCAVDQIDAIVAEDHAATDSPTAAEDPASRRAVAVIDGLAGGLMALRDTTRRTLTVLSTLPRTWEILQQRALASFAARFHPPIRLREIGEADVARRLVEARLSGAYTASGFAPPYPSWPFLATAFEDAAAWSPRELLQACEAHRARCVANGSIHELTRFDNEPAAPEPAPGGVQAAASAWPDLDASFEALCAAAVVTGLLGPSGDENRLAELLVAALRALVRETTPPAGHELVLDTDQPALNARLRLISDDGHERHASFRALPSGSAVAVLSRLSAAITDSGIDAALPFRRLFVVRGDTWPSGAKTAAQVARFAASGGAVLTPSEAELRCWSALQGMQAQAPAGLDAWLRHRRPLSAPGYIGTRDLFAATARGPAEAVTGPPADPAPPPPAVAAAPALPDGIPLGLRAADRQPVSLATRLLPRHIAVMAGSGSGKTVLLRRLIEEAALAGLPSIVLDSNNDLVRLADRWPQRPESFSDADEAGAARFHEIADVVVWTPGRSRANPLSLPVLPDFAALEPDADERELAVGMAAAALQPLVPARGPAGQLRLGVLMDTLRHFALNGGGRLGDLVALLRDLPPEASRIDRAPKLAADLANALLAAQAQNPLLDGVGTPLDPALLLRGPPGRVRISVVNLVGLASDAARQDFVARLLMALFGHIRRHPATAARPVRGLLVMDEAQNFAPAVGGAASRTAAVALARQARKYGLGMVFATQAPRAIDTSLVGNCTTQFFGRANAPAAIEAAREMLASRGGAADDLGRLGRGLFYMTTEGLDRPQKVQTPLCLSHHPDNPPTEDEVILRAALCRLAVAAQGR